MTTAAVSTTLMTTGIGTLQASRWVAFHFASILVAAVRRVRPSQMDFGGHDSDFHDNVVVARNGQNCIGTASFVTGHADKYFNNSCIVYGTERVDDLFENCNAPSPGQEMLIGFNNRYFTAVRPIGRAFIVFNRLHFSMCCHVRPLTHRLLATAAVCALSPTFPLGWSPTLRRLCCLTGTRSLPGLARNSTCHPQFPSTCSSTKVLQ